MKGLEFELDMEQRLQGKTLLGEVVFDEERCDWVASALKKTVQHSGSAGLLEAQREFPLTVALWLVNEAFFNFTSGKYWPPVLGKIGITEVGNTSVRLGQAFLKFLEKRNLPRFRRIKTRWSYLGPILAHCGVPESCLAEFFERVVPRAIEYGAHTSQGFEGLKDSIASLYLTKPTERFIVFGDKVAHDFVRRSADMFQFWQSQGGVLDSAYDALPARVVEAFEEWKSTAEKSRRTDTVVRPSVRRPVALLDPRQGFCLTLPEQSVKSGQHDLQWVVEADASEPEIFPATTEPGEQRTQSREVAFAEPFASLKVQLLESGDLLGSWDFQGITQNSPLLFFEPELNRILVRRSIEAGPLGIVHPKDWDVLVVRGGKTVAPNVVAKLGQLPFGWTSLVANVYDLTDAEDVTFLGDDGQTSASVELADVAAPPPRLVPGEGDRWPSRDDQQIFVGAAPTIELEDRTQQSVESFGESWSIEVRPSPDLEGKQEPFSVALKDLNVQCDRAATLSSYSVFLGQERLLGDSPWGSFEVYARGPLGQDAHFSLHVLPRLEIASDWDPSSEGESSAQVRIRVPADTELRGAYPTDDASVYELTSDGRPIRIHLTTIGFRGRRCELPVEVDVPLPSFALWEPNASRHVLDWTRSPLRLSIAELQGRNPFLLLRLATTWGVPSGGTLCLRGSSGDALRDNIEIDDHGYAKVDLSRTLSETTHRRISRFNLVLELQLKRTVNVPCGTIYQNWMPDALECDVGPSETKLHWKEQIPVENRVVQVQSLLTPWEDVRSYSIPDDVEGVWEIDTASLQPQPGLFRLELGLTDTWTDLFEPSGRSLRIQSGTHDDWLRHPLSSEEGPSGFLFRTLVRHYAGDLEKYEETTPALPEDKNGLAERLLRARATAAADGDRSLRRKLDRLLSSLPIEHVLAAIAEWPVAFEPSMILNSRLFARHWRHGEDAVWGASIAEKLWRLWHPLGAWADLVMLGTDAAGAEKRLIHHLGDEPLKTLCPIQQGGSLTFWGAEPEQRVEATITKLVNEHEVNAFQLARLAPGVAVMLRGDRPADIHEYDVELSRRDDGGWRLDKDDVATLPRSFYQLVGDKADRRVGLFYPRSQRGYGTHTDVPVIDLIKARNGILLETIRSRFQLPSSAVAPEAFQAACFEWSIHAASDPDCRAQLENLCYDYAIPFADDLFAFQHPPGSTPEWRARDELKHRWLPNAKLERLMAVPFLSLAIATNLIWRGMGRPSLFSIGEECLVDLAVTFHELAPKLLEHDLTKVCAIEALERSRRNPYELESRETDARPE